MGEWNRDQWCRQAQPDLDNKPPLPTPTQHTAFSFNNNPHMMPAHTPDRHQGKACKASQSQYDVAALQQGAALHSKQLTDQTVGSTRGTCWLIVCVCLCVCVVWQCWTYVVSQVVLYVGLCGMSELKQSSRISMCVHTAWGGVCLWRAPVLVNTRANRVPARLFTSTVARSRGTHPHAVCTCSLMKLLSQTEYKHAAQTPHSQHFSYGN